MRKTNWPELLHEFIEDRREQPFVIGKNDCFKFALDWIEVATGRKLEHPPYHDAKSAAQAKREADSTIIDFALRNFGTQVDIPLARRGDVVALDTENWQGLGVVVSGGYVAGPGETCIVFETVDKAIMAWRIE